MEIAGLYTVFFGLGIITMLWYTPVANFSIMAACCTLIFLATGLRRMGEMAMFMGYQLPGGTMELCLAASMIGLMAAKMGTIEARRIAGSVVVTLAIVVAYQMTRVLSETVGAPAGSVPPPLPSLKNSMLLLVSFYAYVILYLSLRRFTEHIALKRLTRWALGVVPGTLVLYPATVAAIVVNNPETDFLDIFSWDDAGLRTFVHALFVGVIMLHRWLAPKYLVVDN